MLPAAAGEVELDTADGSGPVCRATTAAQPLLAALFVGVIFIVTGAWLGSGRGLARATGLPMVFPADFTAVGVAASAGESAGDDAEDAPVEAGCEGEPTEDVRLGLFEGRGVVDSFPAGVEAVVPALPVRSPGDAAEEAPARVSVPDPGLLAPLAPCWRQRSAWSDGRPRRPRPQHLRARRMSRCSQWGCLGGAVAAVEGVGYFWAYPGAFALSV